MPSGKTSKRKSTPLDPGSRAVRFLNNLTLTDDYRGQPLRLRVWQEEIVRASFGTLRPDGLRQYREVMLFFPRKQAKTQLTAGIGTYGILGQGTEGEEVVCAAGSREQASHLYYKAEEMIAADPWLDAQVKIYSAEKLIEGKRTGNILKVVSADGRLQHGLNPSILLFDELHTQPDRRLFEALTTAQATRRQPLNFYITTAGNNKTSLCFEEYQRACRARDDPGKYPDYRAFIYEALPDDDWTDERVWHKAMPALGDFANIEYIRSKFRAALESAANESSFRQLFLNQWVASMAKWLNKPRWDACGEFRYTEADLRGLPCTGGLDLAQTEDLTALVLLFALPDKTFRILCRFWLPETAADQRDRKDGTRKFHRWAERGLITLTPGDVIDYDWIKADVKRLARAHRIDKLRIDPFTGMQLALQIRDEIGIDVEFMRQKPVNMNESVRFCETLIKQGRLHHNDNPVLSWQADNAVSVEDSEGNRKLSKTKSVEKIDGMVALIMALAAQITGEVNGADFLILE